jgi:poly-gamma-glutamate capsule biosynthesis protein CapA/YwtB (metallophosphatase superfamily)
MLGRGVAEVIGERSRPALFAPEVVEAIQSADLAILNLECCISDRGEPWPDPGKPFFFRAPPAAVDVLVSLGVDCVTLANNHALDFGFDALEDTLDLLDRAGIARTGAGRDLEEARRPAVLQAGGSQIAFYGVSDHPRDFAASPGRAGIALVDLRGGDAGWLLSEISDDARDEVIVGPHWGPNMTSEPVGYVRETAQRLVEAGATLVAGHSAHVFHGIDPPVLYDLGDFIDDYAVDPVLRNDLSLLFFVTLSGGALTKVEALPLMLEYCYTRPANREESEWIARRFRDACRLFGTQPRREEDRLVIDAGS